MATAMEGPIAFCVSVPVEADEPDRRIGPYRLVRRIGQGGMGTIYEAVRAEGDHQLASRSR